MRRVVRGLGALGAVLLAFVLGAGPAAAHSALLTTSPARDARVPTAPTAVSLTFNEMPQGEFSTIHVTGPDGQRRDDGHVKVVDDVVTEPLAGSRPAGRYVVDWRVVSTDGHPVSGEFTFTALTAAEQFVARSNVADTKRGNSSSHTGLIVGVVAGAVVVVVAALIFLRRRPRSPEPAEQE